MSVRPDAPLSGRSYEPGRFAGSLFVLVADDLPLNRLVATTMLEHLGAIPATACDGAEAVQLWSEQAFDLILMDVMMPVMNGLVATALIRKREAEIPGRSPVPIVAYTAVDLEGNKELFWRAGMTSLLPKPCSIPSLQSCIEALCPDKWAATAKQA